MSDDEHTQLVATIRTRLTCLLWLWVLGEVWFTLLMAGVVIVRLWVR